MDEPGGGEPVWHGGHGRWATSSGTSRQSSHVRNCLPIRDDQGGMARPSCSEWTECEVPPVPLPGAGARFRRQGGRSPTRDGSSRVSAVSGRQRYPLARLCRPPVTPSPIPGRSQTGATDIRRSGSERRTRVSVRHRARRAQCGRAPRSADQGHSWRRPFVLRRSAGDGAWKQPSGAGRGRGSV